MFNIGIICSSFYGGHEMDGDFQMLREWIQTLPYLSAIFTNGINAGPRSAIGRTPDS